MTKSWFTVRFDPYPLSFRLDRRVPALLAILGILSGVLMILSIGYGEYPISAPDVIKTLLGLNASNPDFVSVTNFSPRLRE